VVAQCEQIQQLMDMNLALRRELDTLYVEMARLRLTLSSDEG
jgi:hypothetical protein